MESKDIVEGARAVVLAGGKGTRLSSIPGNVPKVIQNVGGEPFIARPLGQLQAAGFRSATICTGDRAGQVEECLSSWRPGAMSLRFSRETEPLGTAGAAAKALREGGCPEGEFIVMNGDSYVGASLRDILLLHRYSDAAVSLVCVYQNDCARYGRIVTNTDNRVIAFNEKSGGGEGLINAGIYIFNAKAAREYLGQIGKGSLEYDVIPGIGTMMAAIVSRAEFCDIGTPEALTRARRQF